MYSDSPALPNSKHLPGKNPRPTDGFVESIARQAQPITQDASAKENLAWQYGIRLINAGYYWEAHEVLEAVWMRAPPNSRERFLVQCLIQIANAALKHRLENPKAVERLCRLAEECLCRAFPAGTDPLMGFTKAKLSQAIKQCRHVKGSIRLDPEY